ncbi:MAG TPA: SRPBCC family protein [Myxococcaceae bacterium]|nr:SRPBCC family protein [Myxococcaceae bacterium]
MASTQQTYELFIRTTPEQLWKALTTAEYTRGYFFGTAVSTTAKPGEPLVYSFPDGSPCVDGVVIEAEPNKRLVHTWITRYDPEMAREKSRVTWLIEPRGQATKLTAIHDLENAPLTAKNVGSNGWSLVLSGLKTLLETGSPLQVSQ